MEANVKDENDGLDSADKEEEENDEEKDDEEEGDEEEEGERKGEEEKKDDDSVKDDFWDFIKEFKHTLNEKDLEMVNSYESTKIKIRKPMMPYHKTVRKIGNPKVSTHEKRKLLQKAQVGKGVLNSVIDYFEGAKS